MKIRRKVEKKRPIVKEFFGKHRFSKPIKQLMKEMDKELYND